MGAITKYELMKTTNEASQIVQVWFDDHVFIVAVNKTGAVITRGKMKDRVDIRFKWGVSGYRKISYES